MGAARGDEGSRAAPAAPAAPTASPGSTAPAVSPGPAASTHRRHAEARPTSHEHPGPVRGRASARAGHARTPGPVPPPSDAQADLFSTHIDLARSIARRYAGRGEVQSDIEQVALFALHQATRRFDPTMGIPFSHFAERTISGEVKRHFRDTRWAMRVPRSVQERYLTLRRVLEELSAQLGRSPTTEELSARTGIALEDVVEALDAGSVFALASIDAPQRPGGDDGPGPVRELGRVDSGYEAVEARAVLGPALDGLTERDRLVVSLRFDEGLSQSQISDRIGVSQMQVSRILRRVLAQLRHAVDADGGRDQDGPGHSGR